MVDRHHPGKAPTALLQLLAPDRCLTTAEVAEELDLTRRQISDAAACLFRRDYLMWMGAGRYKLSEAGAAAAQAGEVITSGPKGPGGKTKEHRNTLRQRAWRSMRMRRRFTVPDLVVDAATPGDGKPEENIQRYVRGLKAAGYVRDLPRRAEATAPTSNGHKRWILVRDTGPRAPVALSKVKGFRDHNLEEDVLCDQNLS